MRALVAAAALCCLAACHRASPPLPSFGNVPEFQLTAQDGNTFNSHALIGTVWVADFIFTHCPGPCPRMTSQMHQVQEATFKMPEVRLVSFTVDPERDTPDVLAAYARQHHASPEHWFFLTGPQSTLHNLARNVFKVNNVDGTLVHSTRFILVDKHGGIRGYYDTTEPDAIEHLVANIHALAREPA